jgi:hypothetical protein
LTVPRALMRLAEWGWQAPHTYLVVVVCSLRVRADPR